ncbi:MAG: DUF2127 domain-containing protein [Steroidobacteraceae bacterium]
MIELRPGSSRFVEWRRRSWRERLFLLGVWLKGIDGGLELLCGLALLTVKPVFVLRTVQFLTQDEIVEDPHDLVANYLLRAAARLSVGTQHFMVLYLLIHGLMNCLSVGPMPSRPCNGWGPCARLSNTLWHLSRASSGESESTLPSASRRLRKNRA